MQEVDLFLKGDCKMDAFLRRIIDELTGNLNGIKAIVLGGSRRMERQVDFWSDTDLSVILEPDMRVDEHQFVQAINQLGFIIGSERYSEQASMLYRTAIEFQDTIHLLDATIYTYNEWGLTGISKNQSAAIVYGQIEIGENQKTAPELGAFDSYEQQIHQTWFKYLITIKKFARNDNLIGMHLLLDLIREYLVMEMIERDMRKGTNIHRFGEAEQLPEMIKLFRVDEADQGKIFDYIAGLAYEYDEKLMRNIKNYRSRYAQIAEYLQKTKQCLHRTNGTNGSKERGCCR